MAKRILFLVSGLGVGGAELHTLALCAGLRGPEFETRLAVYGTRHSAGMEGRPGAEGARRLGIRGMSSPAGWWRVWRLLREERPDLVVAVNQTPLVVAIAARLLGATRAPVACIYHTTLLRPGDEAAQNRFRRALRRAAALIYVSERQAAYGRESGLRCRRETVIKNGVDGDRFKPDPALRARSRASLGIAENEIVFGVLASLWAEKNHAQVLAAVAALRANGRPARALFVGDGPMRETLERQAAASGSPSILHITGDVGDVRPLIAAFDVGVLASTAVETFSLAALECLASGVPMVMSDIGGAREIVEEGRNGYLVPPGDQAALTATLEHLCDPACRQPLADAARASVQRYALARMLDRYRTLFRDLAR